MQPASNRDIQFIINRVLHTKREKEPGKTIEETSGCVRAERVSKWPDSDDDDDDDNDNDDDDYSDDFLHFHDHSLIFRN
jgi:hypothetical protein